MDEITLIIELLAIIAIFCPPSVDLIIVTDEL
jgi:hypothetical protein